MLTRCSKGARSSRRIGILATVTVLALVAVAASGCTASQKAPAASAPAAASAPGAQPAAQKMANTSAASDVQTCFECGTKKMPMKVVGQPTVENGTQVVDIKITGGTYAPSSITVKAGMPVKVVFTGRAKGCLAKPTFASLGKKADLTTSGSATFDLGVLKPGTYKFTCGMGMNAGEIVVQ